MPFSKYVLVPVVTLDVRPSKGWLGVCEGIGGGAQ
eukprot:SAG31_NODE_19795_length_591_cov_1.058943_1_plen_34_part_10